MWNKRHIILVLLTSLLLACADDEDGIISPDSFGYNYLPLAEGQESIYAVDSIIYNEFTGKVDTLRLQIMERVKSPFTDTENREVFPVDVFHRDADSLPWRFIRVISKTRTNIRYELLSNNLITLPLVFPIRENKSWNVNSLNTEQEQEYSYKDVFMPFTFESMSYDSTLTVVQLDEENLIEQLFSEEKYAANIGLVYRKDIRLETQLNGDINSGYEATIRLVEFRN